MSVRRISVATAFAWAAGALAAFVVALAPPIDDYWLALASAREVLAGADLARAVPLSWIPQVAGALNPQWLAQLVLGVPPLPLSLAINAALLGVGFVLTMLRSRATASTTATAVAMLIVVAVVAPHIIVRPQSFSFALLPLALLLLDRFSARPWLPLAYGGLVALWANLHGAFVIGQVAAVAAATAAVLSSVIPALGPSPGERRLAIAVATAAAALLGSLANPAGHELLVYAYGQGASGLIRELSIEWQPAWPWNPIGSLFWILVGMLLAGRVLRRGAIGLAPGLLLVGLGLLAATGIRHVPWFAVAAAPVLAADVDALLAARPRLARAFGAPAGLLARRPVDMLLAAVGLVVLFSAFRPALPAEIARLEADAPTASAERLIPELPAGARTRILNEQVWGGYLAWRLGDRVEIAMDGRIEIRSRQTWAGYLALMNGEGDPPETLAAADVEWAVLRATRRELVERLEAAGWQVAAHHGAEVLLRAP